MSGFIGTSVMFKMINETFDVKLTSKQNAIIIRAILPLSDTYKPRINVITECVRKIDISFYHETKLDKELFKKFLINYLKENISFMT